MTTKIFTKTNNSIIIDHKLITPPVNNKKKKIFLNILVFIGLFITIIYIQVTNNGNSKKSLKVSPTPAITRKFVTMPVPKNAISLSEISNEDNNNKKVIWDFIKNNYQVQSENSFGSFPILLTDGENNLSLSGFNISVKDIDNGDQRVNEVKKIEKQITDLGFKNINTEKNLIYGFDSFGSDIFFKEDQIFRVFYFAENCNEDSYGGCGIKIDYYNNVEKQISSLLNIINMLGNRKKEILTLMKEGFYIKTGDIYKINNYLVIKYIKKAGGELYTIIAKLNQKGLYDILGNENFMLDNGETLPPEVDCTLMSGVELLDNVYNTCIKFYDH